MADRYSLMRVLLRIWTLGHEIEYNGVGTLRADFDACIAENGKVVNQTNARRSFAGVS